jgi:hypothetical protein
LTFHLLSSRELPCDMRQRDFSYAQFYYYLVYVPSPAGKRDVSFLRSVQIDSGAHRNSYIVEIGTCFSGDGPAGT